MVLGGVAMLVLPQRTSYLMVEPGNTFATENLIEVGDAGGLVDDKEGAGAETDFVTVSRRTASNFDLWIRRRLDPTIVFEPREQVYGDHTKQEVDRVGSQQMDMSKQFSQLIAVEYLGLEVEPTGDGARILQFVEGSPISKAVQLGDVITAIEGSPVTTTDDLRGLLADRKVGEDVEITVRTPVLVDPDDPRLGYETEEDGDVRLGPPAQKSVAMIADPDSGRAILGIVPETFNLDLNLPVDVEMDSGDVSGPSAGLAWTLAVIDRLSPGDLNGGVQVAATGEMAVNGDVLPIGGLPQKAVAVQRAGIRHFLIPAGSSEDEIAEAKRFTDGEIEFHPVATIDEAVAELKRLSGDSSPDKPSPPGAVAQQSKPSGSGG
jgi:PDZ domain-containing protein